MEIMKVFTECLARFRDETPCSASMASLARTGEGRVGTPTGSKRR